MKKTPFITAIGSGNYLLAKGPEFPKKSRAEKEGNFCAPQKGSRESLSSSKDNGIFVGQPIWTMFVKIGIFPE